MNSLDGNEEPEKTLVIGEMTHAIHDSVNSGLTLNAAPSFDSVGGDEVQQQPKQVLKRQQSENDSLSAQDEEIKQALAMALAIQNNPHLKPEEIHELLGQRPPPPAHPTTTEQQQTAFSKQKAHRFTNMFQTTTTTTDDAQTKAHKVRANFTQMADRARGKLNEMMILPTTKSEDGVHVVEEGSSETQSAAPTAVSTLLAFSKPEKPKQPLTCTQTLGLAWKRRGGLAKFSSSSPWERRHFYLANHTHLVYCSLEQTDEPRGLVNLTESTVYASYGHSGAPSPFCLSIAAGGETKWKISLDRNKDQMAWLVAMTAITVQSSVNQYNTQLLSAADPATEDSDMYFHPPDSPSGMASPPLSSKSKQLWEVPPDDGVARKLATDIRIPTEEDHENERGLAVRTAGKVWMYAEPEYVVLLWNVGVVLARAAAVSTFWYVLAFGNFALVWLTSEQVHWRALLPFIRAKTIEPEIESPLAQEEFKSSTPSYVPHAGSSALQLKETTDEPIDDAGQTFAGWRSVPGSALKVRSAGYSTSKTKVESPGQLYDCVAVDVFESPQRYPDMATRVKLPEVSYANDPSPKTWRAPDIFIVSIALPTDPPKMSKTSSDGGGYTVTMYYQMREDTRELLKKITSDEKTDDDAEKDPRYNAVRLWEEWIRRAPTDPKFCSRFKVVPNAHNLTEIGMPMWITKYNGKPFLIKRQGVTGFVHTHPDLSCVEFDVSLHPFPYLAKQGICYMKDSYFKKILVTFGFVIEGRSEDELPECVIGSMQLCYPNPEFAMQAQQFFDGSAPRPIKKNTDNEEDASI